MKKGYLLILAFCCLAIAGCTKKVYQPATATFYKSETTYLYDVGDGSITVRASGMGANKAMARLQARKQAVRDVIFKGVNVLNNVLLSKPLITEVNAAQKYQYFFNSFFADEGAWEQFVSTQDNKPGVVVKSKEKSLNKKEYVIVRVAVPELKNYLIDNGIAKP